MASESQKKADRKYKTNLKRVTIDFKPLERELYEYFANKPNKQQYIKNLIAEEYKANATHKVVYFHDGIQREIVFFKGSVTDCENYISKQIAEDENLYPIEEYKIVKL